MSFVVFTCDPYINLIEGFSYFFNKYWDATQEVYVLGFKSPDFDLPPNFTFLSAGTQEDFPPKSFCEPFKPILKSLPGDTLTYFLDDTFLISPYRKGLYNKAYDLIAEGKAQKIQLFWGGKEQYVETTPFDDTFRAFPQHLNYRCNLAPSVINKEYFLKYFREGMSTWQFELQNMELARNDGATILVSWRDPISPWFNIARQGQFNFAQGLRIEQSDENRFGWNKHQFLDDADMEKIMKYKEWTAR